MSSKKRGFAFSANKKGKSRAGGKSSFFNKNRKDGGKGQVPPTKLKISGGFGGAMSSSSSSSKKDDLYDLEQQFILRLPPGPAMALKRDVQSGAMNLKDKLTIETHLDSRKGRVRYGDKIFSAKLLDLPCILESMKTIDRKTFYKTADICQILICKEDDSSDEEADEARTKKDKEKRFLYSHGLTAPLKNVRKRRFRKTMTKKYTEQPDIEKEVKRLFRADNEAIDVKYEVVYGDEKPSAKLDVSGEEHNEEQSRDASNINLEIFGEVSSSEEEEDDEKEVNIMDSEDEDTGAPGPDTPGRAGGDDTNMGEEDNSRMSNDMDNSELDRRLSELSQQLEELRDRKRQQELEIDAIDNVALRERFQELLEEITREEAEKQKEYELIMSMISTL